MAGEECEYSSQPDQFLPGGAIVETVVRPHLSGSQFFMSFYDVLNRVHGGSSLLLLSLAIISVLIAVLIAVKPAADPANEGLVRKANFVGLIEFVVLAILALTGVIAVFMGTWPWSQSWLWMSLMIVVFYSVALIFVTKPARLAVAEGSSAVKTGLQVILQVGHVLLLVVAFALMVLKPI